MKILAKCFMVACALGLTLSFASRASAKEQWEKCLDKAYNTARKVYDQEQKGNRKLCVKGLSGSQQTCVDNSQAKAEKQEAKLEALFNPGEKCDPVPAFGVNASGTAIGDAAQEAADAIARAIFSNAVDGLDGSKCQDKLIQRPGQAGTNQWKAMRKCAKGSHGSIGAIEACIASGLADARADAKFDKLEEDIGKQCDTLPAPGTDNGDCAGAATAADLRACIEKATTCANCRTMKAMTGGNEVNCNARSGDPKCETVIGSHKCTFAPGSQVVIATQALPFPPYAASGAIDINCGTTAPDGKAPCECELQNFAPISFPAIGYICFTPGGGCPAGEIDCDGGNGLDVTVDSDHNIGACTGNPDCATQCAIYCAPDSAVNSACEGFCVGGANVDLPCTADSACPGGLCPGKDGLSQHTGVCQCECLAVGGAPSVPGGLQCNLSLNINFEISAPCEDGDIIWPLGDRCIPLTTETLISQIHDANNTPDKLFPAVPLTATGAALDCTTLATSVTTGLQMNGAFNFFDSTIGDQTWAETFICH